MSQPVCRPSPVGLGQVLRRRLSALKSLGAVPADVLRRRPYVAQAERLTAVVTAQSAAIDAERLAVALRMRQLVATMGLILALGSGWTAPPEPRARPARLCAVSRAISPPGLGRGYG